MAIKDVPQTSAVNSSVTAPDYKHYTERVARRTAAPLSTVRLKKRGSKRK